MKFWLITGILMGVILLALLGGWGIVLTSNNPIGAEWMSHFPWPVACSSRGCIMTPTWAQEYALASKFSAATGVPVPPTSEALTTVVRQFLVAHAVLKSPVSLADATRYRTEILKLTDEHMIMDTFGVNAEHYDRIVVLPFLQQQALEKQLNISTPDALYAKLAQERLMILLPWHFGWDSQTGMVVAR